MCYELAPVVSYLHNTVVQFCTTYCKVLFSVIRIMFSKCKSKIRDQSCVQVAGDRRCVEVARVNAAEAAGSDVRETRAEAVQRSL